MNESSQITLLLQRKFGVGAWHCDYKQSSYP